MAQKKPQYREVYLQGFSKPMLFPEGTSDEQVDAYLRSPAGYEHVERMRSDSGYWDAFKSGLNQQMGLTALSLAGPDNEAQAREVYDKYVENANQYAGPRTLDDVGNAFSEEGIGAGLGAFGRLIPNMIGGYAAPIAAGMANPLLGLGMAGAANTATSIGGNVERQMQANPDAPVDYDLARGTGAIQGLGMTALEAASMGLANPATVNALVQAGQRQGMGAVAKNIGKGAAMGAAGNVPVEMATRAQAGQGLLDDDAQNAYIDQALTGAAIAGPFAGIGAVHQGRDINRRIAENQARAAAEVSAAETTADAAKTMADQLTAHRDSLQQGLIDASGGNLDATAARKAANKMAADQISGTPPRRMSAQPPVAVPEPPAPRRLSERRAIDADVRNIGLQMEAVTPDAAPMQRQTPTQFPLDSGLANAYGALDQRIPPDATVQQQRFAASNAEITPPHVVSMGGPRPETIVGGMDDAQRAQMMRNAQNAFTRAPMQENGLLGPSPGVQQQQFAGAMAQTPPGQTPDMFQMPTARQVVTGEAPVPNLAPEVKPDIPPPQVGTAPQAPATLEAMGQQRLPLGNQPLSTVDQMEMLPAAPEPVAAPVVAEQTPSVSNKIVGTVRPGETPAQTVARELSNLKRDVNVDEAAFSPEERALAKRADKKVVDGLMQRVNKELGAERTAKAGAEAYDPQSFPLGKALQRIATSSDEIPDNIRNAAEVVHKRLTGRMPEAEAPAAPGAVGQTTFLSSQGKVLPKAFQGVMDDQGVVQGTSIQAGRKVQRNLAGDRNPDVGKTQALQGSDVPRTGIESARWMMRSASEPWMRDLAKKLQPYLKDVPVSVLGREAPQPVRQAFARNSALRGAAYYDPNTGKSSVFLRDGDLAEDVLLHELTHAATEHALQKNKGFRDEIDSLRRYALEQLPADADFFRQHLDGPEEFLAYVHTSPSLRSFLQQLSAPQMKGAGAKLTVWDRIIDAIRKVLGMSPRNINRSIDGHAVVEGHGPDVLAQMDDILNRVLEAREPDIPFSEAAKAAYDLGGPVARANMGFTQVMQKLPKDSAQVKEITNNVANDVTHMLDSFQNKYLSNMSSYENRIRGVAPGVDMANGAARPDIIARLAGNAMQVFAQVAEHGGMKLNAANIWEVVDHAVNLKRAATNAVTYANKYGMPIEQWKKNVTDYAEAYRMQDITDYIEMLSAKLPAQDIDKTRYNDLVQSMRTSMESTGQQVGDAQLTAIKRSARELLQKELDASTGLDPRNLADIRETVKRLSATVTMAPKDIDARLAMAQKYPELETARKELRQSIRQAVDAAHEGGLFSTSYAKELNDREGYISFARLKDFDPSSFDGEKRGALRAAPELHEIFGDTTPIKDVYESTHDMISYLTRATIKAHAGKAMADGATELMGARTIDRSDILPENRARVVSYIDKGKVKFLELQNALDADAFRGYTAVQSKYLGGFRSMANLLRTSIVVEPAFAIRQLAMDAMTAGLMGGTKNPMRTGLDTLQYGLKLMYAAARNREVNDPYILRAKKHGITGRYDVAHVSELSELDLLHSAPSSVYGMMAHKGKNALRFFERIASASELAQRAAVMKRVEMEGGSLTDQLYRAQAIMDYNRHGTSPVVSVITQTVPFITSRLSATHLLLRTLAGRGLTPGDRKAALAQLASNLTVLTAMSSIYAMMAAENEDIQARPLTERYKHMYIPMGDGNLFAIPVRPEAAMLFKWMPERLWSLMSAEEGTDSARNAARDTSKAVANAFLWDLPIPSAVRPLAENYANYSLFTGESVVPDYMKDMPKERQFNDSTSQIAMFLGQQTGQSPLQIDNLIRGYTGMLNTYVGSLMYHVNDVFSDAPQPARNISDEAFIRSFVKNSNVSNQAVNDFYEMHAQARGVVTAYKQAIMRGDMDGATALQDNYTAELNNSKFLSKLGRQMQDINQAIRQINNSDMDADSKRMQVMQLKQTRAQLAAQAQRLKLEMDY